MEVVNDSLFTIEGNKIQYAVHPHAGFDEGTAKSRVVSLINNKYTFSDYFDIPEETKAATFGAGFTIKYGKFSKRIFTQQILTHGAWANPIKASDVVTDINEFENGSEKIVHEIELNQNYPNPFNPTTTIEYVIPNVETGYIPSLQQVTLKIYDVLGREIATLVNEQQLPGKYNVTFDVGANRRFALPSGIYFYRIQVSSSASSGHDFLQTKKMIYLK
ncbi:MAG: T9SS type A sorting domain-containing protein [Ignavibacteriales bacterium]|nr:T9SS type A sorting domain-containing protein [Ignavibacteriales bacterium]